MNSQPVSNKEKESLSNDKNNINESTKDSVDLKSESQEKKMVDGTNDNVKSGGKEQSDEKNLNSSETKQNDEAQINKKENITEEHKIEIKPTEESLQNIKKESAFLTSSIKKSDDAEQQEDFKKIQEDFIETNINGKVNFKSRCQLYMFNTDKKKFEERGVGLIMIVKSNENNMTKIMMTRDGIMRFGCHHYINPRYPLVKNTKLTNAWVWMTTEDTIDDDKKGKKMYLVKFEEDKEALYFKEEYDKGLKSNKEILDK